MEAVVEAPPPQSSLKFLQQEEHVILDSFLPSELRNKHPRVLSVGCGFAAEAMALVDLLPGCYFEGIDNSEKIIMGAQGYNHQIPSERFRVADAAEVDSFGDQPWDLIVLRNPQVHGSVYTGPVVSGEVRGDWSAILKNCVDKLVNGGYIYIASQEGEELDTLLNYYSDRSDLAVVIKKRSLEYLNLHSTFPNREEYVTLLQKRSPK